MKPSFEDWLTQANQIVDAEIGCDIEDLPDWEWRDAYDSGSGPGSAVHLALTSMGYQP